MPLSYHSMNSSYVILPSPEAVSTRARVSTSSVSTSAVTTGSAETGGSAADGQAAVAEAACAARGPAPAAAFSVAAGLERDVGRLINR